MRPEAAFFFSGRFMVTRTTPFERSMISESMASLPAAQPP